MQLDTRALLVLKELDSKKHSGIISLFNQYFVAIGIMSKESGKMLRIAKSFREDADYSDFVSTSKEDAQNELKNAVRFVAEAEDKLAQLIKNQA